MKPIVKSDEEFWYSMQPMQILDLDGELLIVVGQHSEDGQRKVISGYKFKVKGSE